MTNLHLRNHNPIPAVGKPDVAAREAKHVHMEFVGAPAHARHEILVILLEKEERAAATRAEPVGVLFAELDDLVLRETETIQVLSKTSEELGECSVHHHLVDQDLRRLRRRTRNIETITLEIGIDGNIEDILGPCDRLRAVCRGKDENFAG